MFGRRVEAGLRVSHGGTFVDGTDVAGRLQSTNVLFPSAQAAALLFIVST
jgi:hypothetical protein